MSAITVERIALLRQRLDGPRRAGARIGLVPTMGALHAGHGRLIQQARSECDLAVVSIFVNPLQFDREDDLARYPRILDADVAFCSSIGVDVVFAPDAREMYPQPPQCTIEVGAIADHLCGRYRPGHFRGVATVVAKLFGIVQPAAAYFGEKDAQQLAIVRRLVADLDIPVSVIGVPTVREADGLAMSSRNQRLDPCERRLATSLHAALLDAQAGVERGDVEAAEITRRAAASIPRDDRLRLEYLEIVDPFTMQPAERVDAPVVIAGALWVGHTRLIDNVRCSPPEGR